MKKHLAVLFALVLLLAACSPSGGAGSESRSASSQAAGSEGDGSGAAEAAAHSEAAAPDSSAAGEAAAVITEEEVEYIFNRMSHPRAAQTDEHFYYISSADGSLYRVTRDGQEFEVLFAADDDTYYGNLCIVEGRLFFARNGVMQQADLDGGEAVDFVGDHEVVSPYFANGSFYCRQEPSSVIRQYDLTGALVQEHAPAHYDAADSGFVVLGDKIFYFGSSESRADTWDFYAYHVGTGAETVAYAGVFNFYDSFAVDEEHLYLQLAGPAGGTSSADRLVIRRDTGEVERSLPGAPFFVKFGERYYTLRDEGLAEYDETGTVAVLAENAWVSAGVNRVGEYILYCDMQSQCDKLVLPDGTGEMVLR